MCLLGADVSYLHVKRININELSLYKYGGFVSNLSKDNISIACETVEAIETCIFSPIEFMIHLANQFC
jgi:hypothetical protein